MHRNYRANIADEVRRQMRCVKLVVENGRGNIDKILVTGGERSCRRVADVVPHVMGNWQVLILKSLHTNLWVKPYTCNLCRKQFQNIYGLTRHVIAVPG